MVKEWILTSPPDQLLCRNVANGENLISVFTNERLRFTNVKFALRLAHLLSVYISDVNSERKSR